MFQFCTRRRNNLLTDQLFFKSGKIINKVRQIANFIKLSLELRIRGLTFLLTNVPGNNGALFLYLIGLVTKKYENKEMALYSIFREQSTTIYLLFLFFYLGGMLFFFICEQIFNLIEKI